MPVLTILRHGGDGGTQSLFSDSQGSPNVQPKTPNHRMYNNNKSTAEKPANLQDHPQRVEQTGPPCPTEALRAQCSQPPRAPGASKSRRAMMACPAPLGMPGVASCEAAHFLAQEHEKKTGPRGMVSTLPEWIGLSVCHQNGLPKKFKVQEPRERVRLLQLAKGATSPNRSLPTEHNTGSAVADAHPRGYFATRNLEGLPEYHRKWSRSPLRFLSWRGHGVGLDGLLLSWYNLMGSQAW